MPPKGFPLAHIDMHIAEDIGLHKFDILSQRGLGHIKSALEIIYQNQGVKVDIREVEKFKKRPQNQGASPHRTYDRRFLRRISCHADAFG